MKDGSNKMQGKHKKTFVQQIVDIGLGTFLSVIIGVITTPVITRLVSPNAYGSFALFNTYCTLGLSFLCLGLDQAFIRFFYESDSFFYKNYILRKCVAFSMLTWLFFSILWLVLSKLEIITIFEGIQNILFVITLASVVINRFALNCLRVDGESRVYAALNCLTKILYVTIVVFGVYTTHISRLYILIIANILSILVSVLIALAKERQYWKKLKKSSFIGKATYKELLNYGLPLMVSTSVFSLFQATDRISIDYFCNTTTVGIYASAQTLMTAFSIIQQSFNIVWSPKVVEKYESDDVKMEYYVNMFNIISFCMFSFGATMLVFKKIFILFLGEKYRAASTIIPFLMLNPIMYTISETTCVGMVLKKKSICQIYVVCISCVVNILGNTILTPIIGAKGAAFSTGLSYIVYFVLRTFFSQKCMCIEFKYKRVAVVIILFLVMAFYHTNYCSMLVEIVMYICFMISLFYMYKKEFFVVWNLGLNLLKGK